MTLRTGELSPRVWPSYSDLSRSLGIRLTSFKRLRPVDRVAGRHVTRKVGNEVKVPPAEAVDILTAAGLSVDAAERQVAHIIQLRSQRVPALAPNVPAALTRSQVGRIEGNELRRLFYDPPNAAPSRKPELQRLTRLHQQLGDRFVPVEEYLRGSGE